MSLIGNTFILASRDDEENAERYIYARIVMYRNLTSVFSAIKKQFKTVTFTVDVEEFIRKNTGRDFRPIMVGYINPDGDTQDIVVKCIYAED